MSTSDDQTKAKYIHDRDLFMTNDGKPIFFCMRPCKERAHLKGFIEHGGGMISSKYFKDSIKLIPYNCAIFEGVCYTSDYVMDCVKENRRVNLEKYKRTEQVNEDSNGEFFVVKTEARSLGRRVEYSYADDQKIIKYIIANRLFQGFTGNTIWIGMERSGMFARSWQSLKQRFLKKILPNIGSYSLSGSIVRLFKNKGCIDSPDDSSQNGEEGNAASNKYTKNDDQAILGYIIDSRSIDETKGNRIWKKMEKLKVTSHSWQSMKERFKKHIVIKLHTFDINTYNRNALELYFQIKETPLSKDSEPNGDETPDSTVSSPLSKRRKEHRRTERAEKKQYNESTRRQCIIENFSSDEDDRCRVVFDAAQPSTSGKSNVTVVIHDHQQPSTSKGVVHDASKNLHCNISSECSASHRITALEPSLPLTTSHNQVGVSNSPKPPSAVAKIKKSHGLKPFKGGKQPLASKHIVPVLFDQTPVRTTSREIARQNEKSAALVTEVLQRPSKNSVENSQSRASHAEKGLHNEGDSESHPRWKGINDNDTVEVNCERRTESPVIESSDIGRRALHQMSQSLVTISQPMQSLEKNLNVELVVPEGTLITDEESRVLVSIKASERASESNLFETGVQVEDTDTVIEEEPVVIKQVGVSHSLRPSSAVAQIKKSDNLKRSVGKEPLASKQIVPEADSESHSRWIGVDDSDCERRTESPVIESSDIGRHALLEMSQSLVTPSQPMQSPEENLNVELVVPEVNLVTDEESRVAVRIKANERASESNLTETEVQVEDTETIIKKKPVVITLAIDPAAAINNNKELIVGLEEQVGVGQEPANHVSPLLDERMFSDELESSDCSLDLNAYSSQSSKAPSRSFAKDKENADCDTVFANAYRRPSMHSIVDNLGETLESEFNSWVTSTVLVPSPVLNRTANEHTEQEIMLATVEPAVVELQSEDSEGVMPGLNENISDRLEKDVADHVSENVADHVAENVADNLEKYMPVGAEQNLNVDAKENMSTDAKESMYATADDNLHDYTLPGVTAKDAVLDSSQSDPCAFDSNSIGSQDSLQSIERPEALDRMLNGCLELSTEEGFQILKWSGVQMNMDNNTLLNYYRGIIAHDLDELLEQVRK